MMQGFAFGTGSAVAREAVGAVMGGGSSRGSEPIEQAPMQQQAVAPAAGACATDFTAFNSCMQQNSGNIQQCDRLN